MTEFEKKCYRVLSTVPRGKVISYGALARLVGAPKAARAVGNTMKKNPNAPTVPCHRVVKSDGSVGHYLYGSDAKIAILRSEGIVIKNGKIADPAHYFFTD